MEIHGATGAQGTQAIYPRLASFTVEGSQTVGVSAPRDRVEISAVGRMLDGVGSLPEIRHERVQEIRSQIAAGVYETPEKLDLALERMLDELSGF
jgi:negative regulator of flagellin synthesis FlgM